MGVVDRAETQRPQSMGEGDTKIPESPTFDLQEDVDLSSDSTEQCIAESYIQEDEFDIQDIIELAKQT